MERRYKTADIKEKVKQASNSKRNPTSRNPKHHYLRRDPQKRPPKSWKNNSLLWRYKKQETWEKQLAGTLSLAATLRDQPKKTWIENISHGTVGKIWCFADRLRSLHLLQATKTKKLLKSSIILLVRTPYGVCSM